MLWRIFRPGMLCLRNRVGNDQLRLNELPGIAAVERKVIGNVVVVVIQAEVEAELRGTSLVDEGQYCTAVDAAIETEPVCKRSESASAVQAIRYGRGELEVGGLQCEHAVGRLDDVDAQALE